MVTRGEVWLAALDPTVGSEIRKSRPCLVLSPPEMNRYLRTVIVAPLTTAGRPARFRVPIDFAGKPGLVLLDQLRTLDQARLIKQLGNAEATTIDTALKTLVELFTP